MDFNQYPSPIFNFVNPRFLQPHPSYLSIYGDEVDVSDVISLIKSYQYPRPLLINQENTIVNGHLYWKASLALGWNIIPVEVREFPSPEAELEALLLENIDHNKTNEQKVREALAWENIEKVKAKQRQKLGAISTNEKLGRDFGTILNTLQENFPQASIKGQTRDKVAQFVGLGSGRNYSKAKKVVAKIDNLIELGNTELAANLRNTLNKQSIDAAMKLIKNCDGDSHSLLEYHPNPEQSLIQNPSCWNCTHCSREPTKDNYTYFCDRFGLLSFLEQDGKTRGTNCPSWKNRQEKSVNHSNSSYFTITLPLHLKPAMEDAAKTSGMNFIDWVILHLQKAIKSLPATIK